MEEIEVKFLDINQKEIEKKLRSIGAKKVFEKLYRRKVYDYPDLRLDAQGAWVRLRDEGDTVTLAFKQRIGANTTSSGDKGMEEIELMVDDFYKTAALLEKIGLTEKFYEENMRTRYHLDSIHFDIDVWPLLNPYLEVEAESWADIDKAITLLSLDKSKQKIFSTHQVYSLNGIDEAAYKILTFDQMIKK